MRRIAFAIPLFGLPLLVSLAATGQEKQGPDLRTTLEFMNRMVEPESRMILMPNQCEVEMVNSTTFTFYLPDGTTSSKDSAGVSHTEFTFSEIQDAFPMERFRLSDLDPSSIKSQGGALSAEFVTSHKSIEAADLEAADITLVDFGATDMKKSIEVGGLKDSGRGNGEKIFKKTADIASSMFVFKSRDRAERFVTAFIHAVKLCGGRATDFPPTATQKP